MEWNGMEKNRMEWNGIEENGMEWNRIEWNGIEQNGMEQNRIGKHYTCVTQEKDVITTFNGGFRIRVPM